MAAGTFSNVIVTFIAFPGRLFRSLDHKRLAINDLIEASVEHALKSLDFLDCDVLLIRPDSG
ncbi:MAG: hypothetical protein ACNYPE_11370 [Candidatus Azotimanducaceae bacterium WSBS_2022_MAG_OTU7]